MLLLSLMFLAQFSYAQDIPQREVPSLVLNSFKQLFPKALDVEWEIRGEDYVVEFENIFGDDHKAWFNPTGKLLKHKQEIRVSQLPDVVRASIKNDFKGYRIDSAEKIQAENSVTYKVEVETLFDEWEAIYSEDGKLLEKWRD